MNGKNIPDRQSIAINTGRTANSFISDFVRMSLISGEFVLVVSPLAVCERMTQRTAMTRLYTDVSLSELEQEPKMEVNITQAEG